MIAGALSAEEYPGCLSCNARVRNVSDIVGECSKCGIVVKIRKCNKMMFAKVIINTDGH